jgi:hypothetical protein
MPDPLTAADAHRVLSRFLNNVRRSKRLAHAAAQTAAGLPGDAADDVLRASVVFLHAAVEDVLRSVGRLRLPTASGEVLAAIPLADLAGLGDDRRFTLRHLARHRGLTVDDLIYQSVRSYLDRKSFSSPNDVVEFLQKVEIDPRAVQAYLPDIARLMSRRHRIVHQADLATESGVLPVAWSPADFIELDQWVQTAVRFGVEVIRLSIGDSDRPTWDATIPQLTADLV